MVLLLFLQKLWNGASVQPEELVAVKGQEPRVLPAQVVLSLYQGQELAKHDIWILDLIMMIGVEKGNASPKPCCARIYNVVERIAVFHRQGVQEEKKYVRNIQGVIVKEKGLQVWQVNRCHPRRQNDHWLGHV